MAKAKATTDVPADGSPSEQGQSVSPETTESPNSPDNGAEYDRRMAELKAKGVPYYRRKAMVEREMRRSGTER